MSSQQPTPKAEWCLGMLPSSNGLTQPCSRRNDCERYVYRHHSPAASSVAQWLCPGMDDYWPAFEPIHARRVATQAKSQLSLLRLIWAGNANGGDEAAWAGLTHGLELLTTRQVQERFAAEGIEIAPDAVTDLQIEVAAQRPSAVFTVLGTNDEHAVAAVDVGDDSGLHGGSQGLSSAIVVQGGTA